MIILVAGRDPEWVSDFSNSLQQSSGEILVIAIHHKDCSEIRGLYFPWVVRDTGEQKVFEQHVICVSLTRGVFDALQKPVLVDSFVLSTDFGFRPAWECVRAIRLFPQYRRTPIFISSNGAARDLEEIMALHDHCTAQWSA